MIVNSVTLYQTPLDIEHSKVIDVISNLKDEIIENYKLALDIHYDNITYNDNLTKSIKIVNGKCNLVLKDGYENLLKFNYCLIRSNNNNYYFFIDGYESLNDNDTNPSTLLSLVWDYWANNLPILYSNSSDVSCMVERRHIDRFNNDGTYKYFTNNIEKINEYVYDVKDSIDGHELIRPNKILFLKLILNPKAFEEYQFRFYGTAQKLTSEGYQYTAINYILEKPYPLPTYNNISALYIPLGLFDENGDRIFNEQLKISFNSSLTTTNQNVIINQNILWNYDYNSYEIIPNDSDYIISAELTYISPFDISNLSDDISITPIIKAPVVEIPKDLIKPIRFNHSTAQYDTDYNFYGIMSAEYVKDISDNTYLIDNTMEYQSSLMDNLVIDYNRDLIDKITNINSEDFNLTGEPTFFDPKLCIYPFNYLSCEFGNDNFIISPKNYNSNYYRIRVQNFNGEPTLTFAEVINNTVKPVKYVPTYISNTGGVTFTARALEQYMNRQGSQHETSMILSKINSILGLSQPFTSLGSFTSITPFLNTPKNTLGVVDTFAKDLSIHEDLDRTPNIVNATQFAECDTFKQDMVRIYRHECVDNKLLDVYKRDFYLYGYDINMYEQPFKNYRFWFDYVKTNAKTLPLGINNDDRVNLTEMFNRGVFKFHYHIDKASLNSSLIPITNNTNNIEISKVGE